MKNKLFRCTMGILLCFSMLCSTAFADFGDGGSPFPDVSADADYAEAVKTLYQMGIFTGDDKGNFNPDQTITRAEAAKVICLLMGVGDEAATTKKQVFSDVPTSHWAAGYVAKAAELGIINGYGGGKFGPSDPVTQQQIIKMIVCALGYEPLATAFGGWPSGFTSVAESLGIVSDKNMITDVGGKRSLIAMWLYNALLVPEPQDYSPYEF